MEVKLNEDLRRARADGRLDAATHEAIDVPKLARCLAPRFPSVRWRRTAVERGMARIENRLHAVEAHLKALAGQAAKQQEAIGMICTLLRDLDDPYGFGHDLDERIAREGWDWGPERPG